MAVGEGPPRHQGGDDGHPGQLREHAQLLGGAGADDAAADVQHRASRLEDQPRRLAHLLGVRPGHRTVAGQRDLLGPVEGRLPLHRVLGHVDEDGSGPAGRGDVERLGDRARDLGRVGDEEVVLGDRHRDAADVGLLERVRPDRRARDLTGHRDDRHGVHVGVRDRRDQVGRARAAGRHADADLAGRRGVALRGVPGALLVTHQDVADPLGVEQRVVRREDRAAGDPEDVLGSRTLQRPDQALGPVHRFGGGTPTLLTHLGLPLLCPGVPAWMSVLHVTALKNPSARRADEGRRVCVEAGGLSRRVRDVRGSQNA